MFSILEAISCFSPLNPALRWPIVSDASLGGPRNSTLSSWCLPMITKQVGGFLDSEGPRSSAGRGRKSVCSHSGDALQQQEGFQCGAWLCVPSASWLAVESTGGKISPPKESE